MSFHPQPNALGSAEWFHQSEWLDFSMFQNGHCRDQEHYLKVSTLYNKAPFKPIIDGEPMYEDHPVCFNAKDLGTSSAYDIRKYALGIPMVAMMCGKCMILPELESMAPISLGKLP